MDTDEQLNNVMMNSNPFSRRGAELAEKRNGQDHVLSPMLKNNPSSKPVSRKARKVRKENRNSC
jgi:hypothetical protein